MSARAHAVPKRYVDGPPLEATTWNGLSLLVENGNGNELGLKTHPAHVPGSANGYARERPPSGLGSHARSVHPIFQRDSQTEEHAESGSPQLRGVGGVYFQPSVKGQQRQQT
ncbi:hypothetical protein AB1Y20_007702 [Prymnesium parvum]|uniref:Uncharacterized protein n=1 Tax=Prymnesium parvum TaxID=97485 RepID=A0AB34IW89_PRYPA|mmetsp:Transcript_17624/g.42194  ORF Transcript_17624/g.42194 Transcript_17624/m.42194 type:complete len:112 (+) Transcript_17624:570-905(+)